MSPADVSWRTVQQRIWSCEACGGHGRVETNIRQQTPAPTAPVSLLFVGIAPPDQGHPVVRTPAKSATSDPEDNLRTFIEGAARLTWDGLFARGAFFIHAVKCAIIPERGYQNPPNDVVDRCNPVGFADELRCLQPAHIIAFGGAARRAVLKHPALTAPRGVLSKKFPKLQELWPEGVPCNLGGTALVLHPAPFPRSPSAKKTAAAIVREVIRLAGLNPAS